MVHFWRSSVATLSFTILLVNMYSYFKVDQPPIKQKKTLEHLLSLHEHAEGCSGCKSELLDGGLPSGMCSSLISAKIT